MEQTQCLFLAGYFVHAQNGKWAGHAQKQVSWNFWGLPHACCISKMRHNKVETSVSPEKKDMIEKNEISQRGGAYLMSQKLKICKCISYACLTVIWLANSGMRPTKFLIICVSHFLSVNVQSSKKKFWDMTEHVSHLILRHVSSQLETQQGWDKHQEFQLILIRVGVP